MDSDTIAQKGHHRAQVSLKRDILKWVQSLTLSGAPFKSLKRDLANGYTVAEIVSHYYPDLIQLNSYDRGSNSVAKRNNWGMLGRVFLKMNLLLSRELLADVTTARSELASSSLLSKLYVHLSVKGRNGAKTHPDMEYIRGSGYSENIPKPQSYPTTVSPPPAIPTLPHTPPPVMDMATTCDHRTKIGPMKLVAALFHIPEHAFNIHRSTFSPSYARERIAVRMEAYPLDTLALSDEYDGLNFLIGSPASDVALAYDTLLPLLAQSNPKIALLAHGMIMHMTKLYYHVPSISQQEFFQRIINCREFQQQLLDLRFVVTSHGILQWCMARMSASESVIALLEIKAKFNQSSTMPMNSKLIYILAALTPTLLRPKSDLNGGDHFENEYSNEERVETPPSAGDGVVETFLLSECMTTIHTYVSPPFYLSMVSADGGGSALEISSVLHILSRLLEGVSNSGIMRKDELFSDSSVILCTLFIAHGMERPAHLTKAFTRFMAAVVSKYAEDVNSRPALMQVWGEMLRVFNGDSLVYALLLLGPHMSKLSNLSFSYFQALLRLDCPSPLLNLLGLTVPIRNGPIQRVPYSVECRTLTWDISFIEPCSVRYFFEPLGICICFCQHFKSSKIPLPVHALYIFYAAVTALPRGESSGEGDEHVYRALWEAISIALFLSLTRVESVHVVCQILRAFVRLVPAHHIIQKMPLLFATLLYSYTSHQTFTRSVVHGLLSDWAVHSGKEGTVSVGSVGSLLQEEAWRMLETLETHFPFMNSSGKQFIHEEGGGLSMNMSLAHQMSP